MIKERYNEFNGSSKEELGAKILPINLNETVKRAYNYLNSFNSSSNPNGSGIIYYNNNNKNSYIFNINRLYQKCSDLGLVDIHLFPVAYKGELVRESCTCKYTGRKDISGVSYKLNKDKLLNYLKYNLRIASISMVVNLQNFNILIDLPKDIKLTIEEADIIVTLKHLCKRMTSNYSSNKDISKIINKAISETMAWINEDPDFISDYTRWYKDWYKLTDIIIGMDNYIADKIGYNKLDYKQVIPVRIYGAVKDESFYSIKCKYNDELNLYISSDYKKMLKRIKSSMSGQKFHAFMNDLLGKWFTLEGKAWETFRIGISRVKDDLEEMYDIESCKVQVKYYIDSLSKYYINKLPTQTDFKLTANTAEMCSDVSCSINDTMYHYEETQTDDEVLDYDMLLKECETEPIVKEINTETSNDKFFEDLLNEFKDNHILECEINTNINDKFYEDLANE